MCSVADPETSRRRGEPRNMEYKPPRSVAIFICDYFLQEREGHGPLGPHWIRY